MGYDYSQIACVGMDDPASGIGKEKWKFAKACLREVCFFSAAFARRLHPSLLLSVELMLFRQETINAEVSVLISVFRDSIFSGIELLRPKALDTAFKLFAACWSMNLGIQSEGTVGASQQSSEAVLHDNERLKCSQRPSLFRPPAL